MSEKDITPIIEGTAVPIRCANKKLGPDGKESFPMWLHTEVGNGTIGEASFNLTATLHGTLVVHFDGDYDDGRFIITAQDFVEAAHEVYLKRLAERGDR